MDDEIERAASALIGAVPAPAKVIHLDPYPDDVQSDDHRFVVIAPTLGSRFQEMARLDSLLSRMRISADVFVADADEAARPHAVGSVMHEAMTKGRVVAES